MKRRTFIGCVGLGSSMFSVHALSQEKNNAFAKGAVIPAERVEKREYDRTVPNVVVWHTGKDGATVRTVGFVEAASDEKKILFISGFVVKKEIYSDLEKGFFLYFKTSLNYLSLPRRLRGQTNQTEERYAFNQQFTAISEDGFKSGLIKVDYKKMRLIEKGKIYSPESLVLESISSGSTETSNLLKKIEEPIAYPEEDLRYPSLWVSEVLYFNMDHIPLEFKLELPPLVINGASVPFPVCHFEPYNILTKKWG